RQKVLDGRINCAGITEQKSEGGTKQILTIARQVGIRQYDANTAAERKPAAGEFRPPGPVRALHWSDNYRWVWQDGESAAWRVEQGQPKQVPEPGAVFGFVEANGILWIAGQKGLWQSNPRWKEPLRNTNVVDGKVAALCRSENTLWVATEHQVYRINGLRPGPWDAHIGFEPPHWYHYTGEDLVLRWTVGDLDFRTCPDLAHGARFQVLDGDQIVKGDVTTAKGDDGAPLKGTYEITIRNVPVGRHS